jgi:hypothetical protein
MSLQQRRQNLDSRDTPDMAFNYFPLDQILDLCKRVLINCTYSSLSSMEYRAGVVRDLSISISPPQLMLYNTNVVMVRS